MKRIVSAAALMCCALTLTACTTDMANLPSGGGGNLPPGGGTPGQNQPLPGSAGQVLSSYTATYATSGTPSYNQLLGTGAGVQGFGAQFSNNTSTTTGRTAAANAPAAEVNAFATATVAFDGQTLKIAVDNRTFTLAVTSEDLNHQLTGTNTRVDQYFFGGLEGSPERGLLIKASEASLAAYAERGNESDADSVFVLVATGRETPTAGLPTQLVQYKGHWVLTMPATGQGGEGMFVADADFATKVLTWEVRDRYGNESSGLGGQATISGSQFAGAFTSTSTCSLNPSQACIPSTMNGELAGAFYGANAEEIAGIVNGTVDYGGQSTAVTGGFIGGRAVQEQP